MSYTLRPHSVSVFDSTGSRTTEFTPFFDESLVLEGGGRSMWASQVALPLGSGFLQGIADLGSDRRLLVRYDSAGETLRVTTFDVPLGFFATDVINRRAAAIRTDRTSALVVYVFGTGESPLP